MSDVERKSVIASRIVRGGSWRRPPLWDQGSGRYMLTAACYEHRPIIGKAPERIANFEQGLLNALQSVVCEIHAHVILPNHYHCLVMSENIGAARKALGRFHGRNSYSWNGEDGAQGRQVFHGSAETIIKSERHFQATLNYIHHNPVKHGYVNRWQDWPYSSASDYLALVGVEEARKHWMEYPETEYGKHWDLF